MGSDMAGTGDRATAVALESGGETPAGWTRYAVGRGRVGAEAGALRLMVEDAEADRLADAQIDDYHGRDRVALAWRPPLRLEVRARWSRPSADLLGTTGFGFWNDPFDPGGGFAATPAHLWFFHASAPSRVRLRGGGLGRGLVAGAMRGAPLPRPALLAGSLALRVPGLARVGTHFGERRLAGVDVALPSDLDLTAWHDYELTWDEAGARFAVDGTQVAVLPADRVPGGPLGFVAWVDNNWLALGDDGRLRGGRLAIPGRQWLDLDRVEIVQGR